MATLAWLDTQTDGTASFRLRLAPEVSSATHRLAHNRPEDKCHSWHLRDALATKLWHLWVPPKPYANWHQGICDLGDRKHNARHRIYNIWQSAAGRRRSTFYSKKKEVIWSVRLQRQGKPRGTLWFSVLVQTPTFVLSAFVARKNNECALG